MVWEVINAPITLTLMQFAPNAPAGQASLGRRC
jgi:hypothetical protein